MVETTSSTAPNSADYEVGGESAPITEAQRFSTAMPIEHSIWRVEDRPTLLNAGRLATERKLEDMIESEPRILSPEWMLISRQAVTSHGGRIDLLAIAPDGGLVLIELKRDKTPREIVAQALDYASWVEQLSADRIAELYRTYSNGSELAKDFHARFGSELDEDELNSTHQIIVVAAELDASTERIVGYLNDRDIAINVVFFKVFDDGQGQLLSRVWLIDPGETQSNAATGLASRESKEPWNGEYYFSYGYREWDKARTYGFVSGGGGIWYSRTLDMLARGDRIWVNIPKTGYVGVGVVQEPVQLGTDFAVEDKHGERLSVLDVLEHGDRYRELAGDPETMERFVRVEWLDTVSESEAFNEVGLFGNQNTVCRPRTAKWRHTVERLKTKFSGWNS